MAQAAGIMLTVTRRFVPSQANVTLRSSQPAATYTLSEPGAVPKSIAALTSNATSLRTGHRAGLAFSEEASDLVSLSPMSTTITGEGCTASLPETLKAGATAS
jgi:hypothetical protein